MNVTLSADAVQWTGDNRSEVDELVRDWQRVKFDLDIDLPEWCMPSQPIDFDTALFVKASAGWRKVEVGGWVVRLGGDVLVLDALDG